MEIEKLNKFSKTMFYLFSSSYPQWIPLINNMPANQEAFEIVIPSPPHVRTQLKIDTNRGELSVFFDDYHEHFGRDNISETETFNKAKRMIKAILKGQFCSASIIRDGQWRGSTSLKTKDLNKFKRKNPKYNRIISWNQAYLSEDNPKYFK